MLIDRLRLIQHFFIRIILQKPKRDGSFPLYPEQNVFTHTTHVCA